ncbi:hypothetical protein [Micromonospora sp. WMMC250]|uniref:hypothetical protein n=1 Tax=Micromonospora sp. WMMC250 TaxID=3014781 RepID=UPI0022B5F3A6|nr:hypothetical protein [Micromonospora sp. WMMC250]MCZ7376525.1 hypothetical protein [Micromonospora sp. WMMC250]
MNATDIANVLAKAAAFDQRTVGQADILAWHEALHDLDAADALAAVTRHYASSEQRLMPVHVRRIASDLARERHRVAREEAERLALEATAADAVTVRDRSADVADMLATLRDRLGPSDPSVLRRAEWVREERLRQRDAVPNPHYQGPPPPGGWPIPAADDQTA